MFKHEKKAEKITKKKKKWRYSIKTKTPNQKALYSVVYPIINSVSASIKSNGALCNKNKTINKISGHNNKKKKL